MNKALVLLTIAFAFAGTVGCAEAPTPDLEDSAPAVAESTDSAAAVDVPKSEPIAETPAPAVSEPPIAKSPSLGASSSGRGH